MATYATTGDFDTYSEDSTVTDAAKLDRYLARAELYVDLVCGSQRPILSNGRRF